MAEPRAPVNTGDTLVAASATGAVLNTPPAVTKPAETTATSNYFGR
ncbi:hypothetical protein [Flexivirga meconopsidis]|nr:hypothetical protein [Flexivirga meconopsidis]